MKAPFVHAFLENSASISITMFILAACFLLIFVIFFNVGTDIGFPSQGFYSLIMLFASLSDSSILFLGFVLVRH